MAEMINYSEMVERRGGAQSLDGLEDEDWEEEAAYSETFDKLKEIGKELLFSGASRSLENKDGLTPIQLLNANSGMLKPSDMAKMQYVLSVPGGCKCLRLTRPIEKVERTTTT